MGNWENVNFVILRPDANYHGNRQHQHDMALYEWHGSRIHGKGKIALFTSWFWGMPKFWRQHDGSTTVCLAHIHLAELDFNRIRQLQARSIHTYSHTSMEHQSDVVVVDVDVDVDVDDDVDDDDDGNPAPPYFRSAPKGILPPPKKNTSTIKWAAPKTSVVPKSTGWLRAGFPYWKCWQSQWNQVVQGVYLILFQHEPAAIL